jgi:hypothetical protein
LRGRDTRRRGLALRRGAHLLTLVLRRSVLASLLIKLRKC